jgi:hypothetical protein
LGLLQPYFVVVVEELFELLELPTITAAAADAKPTVPAMTVATEPPGRRRRWRPPQQPATLR